MQLYVDSNAAYLIAPKARSWIAGYYYFKKDKNNKDFKTPNHPILIERKCLTHVVSSAEEAETGRLFLNAQNKIVIWRLLKALGHPQVPVPLKTDNKTALGFVIDNINQRKSKTWDMLGCVTKNYRLRFFLEKKRHWWGWPKLCWLPYQTPSNFTSPRGPFVLC